MAVRHEVKKQLGLQVVDVETTVPPEPHADRAANLNARSQQPGNSQNPCERADPYAIVLDLAGVPCLLSKNRLADAVPGPGMNEKT